MLTAQQQFEAYKTNAIAQLKEALAAIEATEFPESGNWGHTGEMGRNSEHSTLLADIVLNRES
jgi:hypothetical protein